MSCLVSVYTKSLSHIMDVMTGPLIQSLENRLERNKVRINELERRKGEMLEELRT